MRTFQQGRAFSFCLAFALNLLNAPYAYADRQLPPCRMDSFVHQAGAAAEEIYGDEGKNGDLPPLFGFSQRSRIDAGIQGVRAEGLTTGHGSLMPSAWGADEFIAPPGEWVYSGRNQYNAPDLGIDVTALLSPLIAQEAQLLQAQARLQQNISVLENQIVQLSNVQDSIQMLNGQMASLNHELNAMNNRIGQVNELLGRKDEDLPYGVSKNGLRAELNHLNGLVAQVNKQMNGVTGDLNNLANPSYVNSQLASLTAERNGITGQLDAIDTQIADVRAKKLAIYSSANLH